MSVYACACTYVRNAICTCKCVWLFSWCNTNRKNNTKAFNVYISVHFNEVYIFEAKMTRNGSLLTTFFFIVNFGFLHFEDYIFRDSYIEYNFDIKIVFKYLTKPLREVNCVDLKIGFLRVIESKSVASRNLNSFNATQTINIFRYIKKRI